MAERTVTVSSLSKSHAMTGWRIGWIVGPEALTRHLNDLLLCMIYGSPAFIQDAAVAALTDPAAEAESAVMCAAYRRRRDLLRQSLAGVPGVLAGNPEGGMFVLLDVRGSGLSAYEFADRLLDETGVCTLPAAPFGASAAGHVRLSLGIADTKLAEACRRIAAFAGGRQRG